VDTEQQKRLIIDQEHLRLLALLHYIAGGLTIAFSSLFIVHTLFFAFLASHPQWIADHRLHQVAIQPFALMRMLAFVMGSVVVLGIAFGVAQILSGRFIARRRYRGISLGVAILNLLLIPYGTLLGVFTLVVLARDNVRDLYLQAQRQKHTEQPQLTS
jgi:hypothetical protein